jgi:hypothetical protein
MTCLVPSRLGSMSFPVSETGVNFHSIAEYCSEKSGLLRIFE